MSIIQENSNVVSGIREMKVIEVITTHDTNKDTGVTRIVHSYFTLDGDFLAERDQYFRPLRAGENNEEE
jgi:hypothetical protein